MNGAERLLYGQIENIIARVLWIREDLRPVLRARLRHLRKIGVPELPNVGSGGRVHYTYEQALEMLVAIALENIGQEPSVAKSIAKIAVDRLLIATLKKNEGAHLFVILAARQDEVRPLAYVARDTSGAECIVPFDRRPKNIPRLLGRISVLGSGFLSDFETEIARELSMT
jgi:hypothetical protein